MEVRRRSLSSEYEFRERRTAGKKKRGALPLAMVLSFNDKDVHPDCPNVSNPYHKCGRHCLDKIPTGQIFLDAIRSGGDQEWDKKSEKRGVNPNCPYASNPYHKCSEYCSGKLSEKPQDAGKDKPGVNPKKEVFTTEKEVKPECIYASNPYHVCAEYCVPIVPEKDQPRQSTRLKGSREGEKVLIARHASNPNQECAESCLQIETDRNVADREKPKGALKKTNKGSVHLNRNVSSHNKVTEYFFEDAPKKEHLKEDMQSKKENEIDHTTQLELSSLCKNSSKADHVCDEYCFQSVPEREQYGQAGKPKEESEIIVTAEQVVNFEYKNASNPSDVHPEYCSESVPKREQHEQIIRLKSTKQGGRFLNNRHSTAIKPKDKSKVVVVAEKGVNLEQKSASNPDYVPVEYGFQCVLEREQHRPKKTKGVSFKIDKSKALPDHKHVSNSYHEVIDDCFDYNPEQEHPNGAMKPKEERIIVTTKQRVDLVCKYASNPYHECTEYCFQNLPNEDQRRKVLMKSMEKEEAAVPLDRVNPQCKHASNPYHVCAEYCFSTVPEKDQPGQSTRLKISKEGEVLISKHASNPNNEYAESCFQIVTDRNIAKGEKPEGAPKKTKKDMKSKKENEIDHTTQLELSSLCKNASKADHACDEYCFRVPEREQYGQVIKLESSKEGEKVMSNNIESTAAKPKEESEIIVTVEQVVNLEYKNAPSPSDVRPEYCSESVPEREQHEQFIRLNSTKEGDTLLNNRHSTGFDPCCKLASSPHHECTEFCFKNTPDRNLAEEAIEQKDKTKIVVAEKGVNLEHKSASNPDCVPAECSFQCVLEKEQHRPKRTKGVSFKIGKSKALPDHKHISNSYHEVLDDCIDYNPKQEHPNGAMKLEEERIIVTTEQRVDLVCKYASNPYHECTEYCFQSLPNEDQRRRVLTKSMEKEDAVVPLDRVNPQCKHASNPYHVCAEYCFPTVAEKDRPGQSTRLKVSKEGEKVLSTKHESIPNNEYAESCFQIVTDRNIAKGERPKGAPKKTNKGSLHLSRNASSHNKATEYFFEDAPKKEHLKEDMKSKKENEIDHTTQLELSSLCKNASKSDHVCDEYCYQSVPEREQYGQVIKLESSKEEEKVMSNNIESTAAKPKEESEIIETVEQIVNLENKNVSNSSNVCPEYCSESVHKKDISERDQHEQIIRLKSTKEGDKFLGSRQITGFDAWCQHASNPHHECTEFCFKNTPDRNLAKEEKMKGVSFKIDKSSALPDHKHISNPYHEVIEDCFDDNPEQRYPNGAMKPKEEGIVVTAERGVDLVCKYASNPYHECTECCFQNLPNDDQGGKAITKSMEKEVAVVPLERVNLQCKLASNPYHVCAECCFQNVSNGHHPERSMMASKEKKIVLSSQVVNLKCKYSSNPYHVCAEYCFKNVLERDPPRQTIKKLKEEDAAVLPSERQVSPECNFASNPYHVCAEYCIKNALEGEQQGQVMKLKSLKELKGLVNNKEITSGHPRCEYSSNPYHQCAENCFNKNVPASKIPDRVVKRIERKKEKSYSPKRDDNPMYKNASNSFHRCPDYCSEETSPTNEVVEGSNTATIKKKKRNSSKGNKRNHPIVEKISLNSRYMEASKPGQNYVESSERIILDDGTEKSSMDSKYGGAFNPTNHNFNLNNGISMYMQYETKDLQSAKMVDIKNPKVPTDVPPLHIDASDLFNEWAKYCSQTKAAEDEIVKQEKKVGIGELITRNGKANSLLKDYDAANLEKVQATVGFPRSSFPILLLFLLGFLLALLHWARVIHSLVISSEKHEEPERMKHERHLDPKCKKVSDPCHKFSHYRFPGVDDEIQ